MKNIFIILFGVILLSSCRTSKKISLAIDTQTQEIIGSQSCVLSKGKVCFISTTSYPATLPGMKAFKNDNSSTFVYAAKGVEISSLKSQEASIDTMIRSRFLTTSAMETAAKKARISESICISDYEFRDSEDKLALQQVINEHHPDIFINLRSLNFHISGEKEMQAYILSTIPNRVYSTSQMLPHNILSGDIIISYSAVWEITGADGMKVIKSIHQEGKAKIPFYHGFDLADELNKCAIKAGKDFSKLVVQK